MSKNINFERLAAELAALDAKDRDDGHGMLVARILHDLTPKQWQTFCQTYPVSHWGALPLSSLPVLSLADLKKTSEAPSELVNAITAEIFTLQLARELKRLARMGGELSLICTTPLAEKATQETMEQLTLILAKLLQEHLECCDSLGADAQGHPLVLFPGAGPIKSRHLAEQLQKDYIKKAKPILDGTCCALGIVCVSQGETVSATDLVGRVENALNLAQTEQKHIHQIGPEFLAERQTLVHSDEKRFLFFGGA